ncbi:MAG: hypothetical protein JO211_03105 [Acidobacteriaceae bacterium]|nr:hypothetical protein [Acidobacteriaceae bacterium]
MARGWESKAVESQIEAAENRASRAQKVRATAEEINFERERESLELSRTRVLQDIKSARNARYRDLLNRSLQFLDEKLKALNEKR